jgi:pimeloyl-ACP methyl ester carboxylesterase
MGKKLLTIVTVPCFSGAPWDVEKFEPLLDLPLVTMRLPEGRDDVEDYADFIEEKTSNLDCFILVGDSFGAVICLAFATRQPPGMHALVMSGGFAANPVRNPLLKARIMAARFLPGPLYRAITLRMHAASLSSIYDAEGQVPWSEEKSRKLFEKNTPFKSYVARAHAALEVDYLDQLSKINVPTLIITPSQDKLIGRKAAGEMLSGIADSREVVLQRTGHMLRYSHPVTYAKTIRKFLEEVFGDGLIGACV